MTPKGINTGLLGETISETKVHLEGALRNGHSNINVQFLNTPPLRHVPTVKIIRSVQRSEVPDEGPPGAAAQASRMRLPSRKYWAGMSRASAFAAVKTASSSNRPRL